MNTRRRFACPVIAAICLLGGCGEVPPFGSTLRPPVEDSGPERPVDMSHVVDAVPRRELLSRYGNPASYTVAGKTYHPLKTSKGFIEEGIASWYGRKFHGRRTSSGEPYDMYAMTAAHKTLPLPSYVEVTNLDNGRRAVVRVNDRGPFKENRIIDLSYAAASRLGITATGTAHVRIHAITAPPPPALSRPPTQVPAQRVYLQVGAFREIRNAQRMRNRLEAILPPRTIAWQLEWDETAALYRVRTAPLGDPQAVPRLVQALDAAGIDAVRIIRD